MMGEVLSIQSAKLTREDKTVKPSFNLFKGLHQRNDRSWTWQDVDVQRRRNVCTETDVSRKFSLSKGVY